MTSAQDTPPSALSPLAAISLKLVGVVTILAFLVDFIVLALPPDFASRQWQMAASTQLIDRGLVPLVGIALVLTGCWIESTVGLSRQAKSILLDLRFWVCFLASLLGLLYLLLTVFHPNNVRLATQEQVAQISTEADRLQSQLDQLQGENLGNQIAQQRDRIQALLQDEARLQQAIERREIPPALVEQFQRDPGSIETFLQQQGDQVVQQLQTRQQEIVTQRQKVQRDATRSAVRVVLNGLLLTLGYIVIGWLGLRRLFAMTTG